MNQPIEKLRRGVVNTNIVATGGKNNDLRLWDLKTKQMTFNAKNVSRIFVDHSIQVVRLNILSSSTNWCCYGKALKNRTFLLYQVNLCLNEP